MCGERNNRTKTQGSGACELTAQTERAGGDAESLCGLSTVPDACWPGQCSSPLVVVLWLLAWAASRPPPGWWAGHCESRESKDLSSDTIRPQDSRFGGGCSSAQESLSRPGGPKAAARSVSYSTWPTTWGSGVGGFWGGPKVSQVTISGL